MRFFLPLALSLGIAFAQAPAPSAPAVEAKFDSPKSGEVVTGDSMQIEGVTKPGFTVSARNQTVTADAAGHFRLKLPTPPKDGSYTLNALVQGGGTSAQFSLPFVKSAPVVQPAAAPAAPPATPKDTTPVPTPAAPSPAPASPPAPDTLPGKDTADLAIASKDSAALRVAVFIPNAPGLGDPQLQALANRYKKELAAADPSFALEFVSLDKLVLGKGYAKAQDCRSFECAMAIGRQNDLDIVVVSQILHHGTGNRFETSAVSVLRGGTLAADSADAGASLGALESPRAALAVRFIKSLRKAVSERGIDQQKAVDLLPGTLITQTVISGVLKADKSPYLVRGNLQVPAGQELVIEPGVTLLFEPGQFAGLYVYGQIDAQGTADKPIKFISASRNPNPWDWNRILLAGPGRSTMRHVEVANSNFGIHVENSGLALQNSYIHDNSLRGIFVRNSQVDIQDARIENGQIVALQAGALADVKVSRTLFTENRNAIAVMDQGQVELMNSQLRRNDRGILLMDGGSIVTERNSIEQNQVGISSVPAISASLFDGVRNNTTNFQNVGKSVFDRQLEEPAVSELDRVQVTTAAKPTQIGEKREAETWNTFGNIQVGAGYTKVNTATNPGPLNTPLVGDTIVPGQSYPNVFTSDGPWGKGMAYVLMESTAGRGLEIQAEGRADQWVTARAKPVTIKYWSPSQVVTVGHLQESASPLVLTGFELLGLKYALNFGRNVADAPLFTADGFWGESQQPFRAGDRNPDLFGQHISSTGSIAQRLTGFGRMSLAPSTQTRLQVGAIASKDNKSDPLIRDGFSEGMPTRDPLAETRAAYMAGEWATRSGSFQLNFDMAIGRADTTDAMVQRALDHVFSNAGLSQVSVSQVRSLFVSDAVIQSADSATVAAILPMDTSVTLAKARDSLVALRHTVNAYQTSLEDSRDQERAAGMDWTRENTAERLGLAWKWSTGSFKFDAQTVGMHYYSPGARTLMQNSRDYSLDWTQGLKPWWDVEASYDLTVQNATNGERGRENVLGISEGDQFGFGSNDSWNQAHLQDLNRAKLTHLASMDHRFRIGSSIDVSVGYRFEHDRQHLPTVLKPLFTTDAAIFRDPFFAVQGSSAKSQLDLGFGDTATVDSARWASYQALAGNSALALGFQDLRYKNGAKLDLQWRRTRFTLRVGGEWTWQLDHSAFTVDSLMQGLSLADTTLGKLGYLPGAQTWFEQSYPISLTGKIGPLTNKATFKPRWKTWKKANLHEFEWRGNDRLEIPMFKRKVIVTLIGEAGRKVTKEDKNRYFFVDPTDSSKVFVYYTADTSGNLTATQNPAPADNLVQGSEDTGGKYKILRQVYRGVIDQVDLAVEGNLRYNVSAHAYTEADFRVDDVRRPDQLSEQHRDFTGGLTFFYSF